jgi:Tfp pilus assembly PilM family ATPase
MNFLSLFHKQLIGLDIGVSSIKAVELSTGKTPRLIAYNRIPLAMGIVTREGR